MSKNERFVLILGYFAALHSGHRSLISLAQKIATENDVRVKVLTFDDGMYEALGRDFREIYVLREREQLLHDLGVTDVDVLPITTDFLSQSPEKYLSYLSELHPFSIVVGTDYTFGKGAKGDAHLLKSYFSDKGVPVYVCDLLTVNGEKISSTMIGKLLQDGDVESANTILGTPFFLSGKVQKGLENGKKIGFPTLNLTIDKEKFLPKFGVYASITTIDGISYPSMTNIGPHPTLSFDDVNVETHVFGLEKDLYGTFIKVEILHYIREIIAFSSLQGLQEQLKKDKKAVLEVLS